MVLTLGILALHPIFGAGLAGSVAEQSHRSNPRDSFSISLEINFPILWLEVTALVDKDLELLIRDFVSVNPIVF